LTSVSQPVVFLNGSRSRSAERGKDRPKPFFDRAASFRVGKHVKLIVAKPTNRASVCRLLEREYLLKPRS
jgi:hypothetical protein